MKQNSTIRIDAMTTNRFASSIFTKQLSKRFLAMLGAAMLIFSKPAGAQSVGASPGRTEWSIGYNASIPIGEMHQHANTLHSFAMSGFYRIPASMGKIDVGVEVTLGNYAYFTKTEVFGMNGVQTPMHVNYSSNATTTSAVFRYNYFQSKSVTAFASLKGGWAGYSSNIMIEDPNDPDGCKPLDQNKLISDDTWIVGLRTGANIDLKVLFPRLPDQFLFFQPYVGFIQGGKVDYINVRNTDMDDQSAHGHSMNSADGSNPVEVRFVNMQTGLMHTHEVARVYTSPVQYLECGFNVAIRLF
jgi:hypothetical protein